MAILKGVGAWLKINGEGIFATRPWKVFGEGPDARMGDRDNRSPYGAKNFRFTQSKDGRTIYVVQMGWPGGGVEVLLTSFANGGPGGDTRLATVSLLGSMAKIDWSRDDAGLRLVAPTDAPSENAVVYKISLGD